MNERHIASITMTALLALLAVAMVAACVQQAPAPSAPKVAPTAQAAVSAQATPVIAQIYYGQNITQSATSGSTRVLNYVAQDCYAAVSGIVGDGVQTVTVSLIHSPDQSNWVTLLSFDPILTNSVIFSNSEVYGAWERATVTLDSSFTTTVNVECVLK